MPAQHIGVRLHKALFESLAAGPPAPCCPPYVTVLRAAKHAAAASSEPAPRQPPLWRGRKPTLGGRASLAALALQLQRVCIGWPTSRIFHRFASASNITRAQRAIGGKSTRGRRTWPSKPRHANWNRDAGVSCGGRYHAKSCADCTKLLLGGQPAGLQLCNGECRRVFGGHCVPYAHYVPWRDAEQEDQFGFDNKGKQGQPLGRTAFRPARPKNGVLSVGSMRYRMMQRQSAQAAAAKRGASTVRGILSGVGAAAAAAGAVAAAAGAVAAAAGAVAALDAPSLRHPNHRNRRHRRLPRGCSSRRSARGGGSDTE